MESIYLEIDSLAADGDMTIHVLSYLVGRLREKKGSLEFSEISKLLDYVRSKTFDNDMKQIHG